MDGNSEVLHALCLAERINDRGCVHPQLDNEGEKDLEVAVLRCHRRYDGSESEGKACHHGDKDREQEGVPVEGGVAGRVEKCVEYVYQHEEPELDAKTQKITGNVCNRHDEPREVDFSEYRRVVDEGIGGLCQALCEVVPHTCTGEVEKRPRNAVCRDSGYAAEDDHVHEDRQSRLNDEPYRTENSLFVLSDDIPFDE